MDFFQKIISLLVAPEKVNLLKAALPTPSGPSGPHGFGSKGYKGQGQPGKSIKAVGRSPSQAEEEDYMPHYPFHGSGGQASQSLKLDVSTALKYSRSISPSKLEFQKLSLSMVGGPNLPKPYRGKDNHVGRRPSEVKLGQRSSSSSFTQPNRVGSRHSGNNNAQALIASNQLQISSSIASSPSAYSHNYASPASRVDSSKAASGRFTLMFI